MSCLTREFSTVFTGIILVQLKIFRQETENGVATIFMHKAFQKKVSEKSFKIWLVKVERSNSKQCISLDFYRISVVSVSNSKLVHALLKIVEIFNIEKGV